MDISGMKVFVPNPIHEAAVTLLRGQVRTVLWDDEAIGSWHEEADAVMVRTAQVRKADIAACRKLKVIAKHGIGVDNIDVADAKAAGIKVVYTPFENVDSVAELAVTFMMALSRNLYNGNKALREGRTLPPAAYVGTELGGKTLGIVGLGRIGRRTGTILTAAFGMKVLAFDPFLPEEAWSTVPFPAVRCAAIEEMLAGADYVTVHVPLTDQTRSVIDAPQLACCKPGAFLVNTSRGGTVNETALYDALQAGNLRGAASDVFVTEPPAKDHPLLSLDNFMAMPHIGANTQDALYRMGMTAASDILSLLAGKEAKYYVP